MRDSKESRGEKKRGELTALTRDAGSVVLVVFEISAFVGD